MDFTSAVIVALLELAFPVAVQYFIDQLLPGNDWNLIVLVSILLLLVYIISTLLQYVVTYLGHKLGINIETDMRQRIISPCSAAIISFF